MKLIKQGSLHSSLSLISLILLSIFLHAGAILFKFNSEDNSRKTTKLERFKVIEFGNSSPTKVSKNNEQKNIELKDLNNIKEVTKKRVERARAKNVSSKLTSPLKKLSITENAEINSFLKESNLLSAESNKISDSSVNFQIQLPPGLKLSELNDAQLVLYNFRLRTAKQYFNSFYSNLNDHKTQKPHLSFPMTNEQEKMTGKMTYDKTGNIIKIQMIQVTSKVNLQEFFESLLKKMHTVANPPEMILNKDNEFSVYFSLNID